jgi:hypothetical protein
MRIQKLTSVLLLVVCSMIGLACSADKMIWMAGGDSDPLYRFVVNEKAGYIDSEGKVVVPATLDVYGNSGREFHDGLLEAGGSDGVYFDKSGHAVKFPKFYRGWDFSEGLAAVLPTNGGKWGFIDTSGRFAIEPRFDNYPAGYVSSFSNGYAMIESKQRVGYIDRSGEFAINPQFFRGTPFHEGRAWAVISGPCFYFSFAGCPDFGVLPASAKQDPSMPRCKYALIDKTGQVLSDNTFEGVTDFSEGLAAIAVNGLWGYVDKNGIIVIPPRFSVAGQFSDGLAVVTFFGNSGNVERGYIDHNGVIVIPTRFAFAEDFSDGLAVVADSPEGPYYYINSMGEQAIRQKFMLASPFFKGLSHVRLSKSSEYGPYGKYAYIDRSGQAIFTYDRVKPRDEK